MKFFLDSIANKTYCTLVASVITLAMSPLVVMGDSTMFQANLERTGVYNDLGPENDPELVWKFGTGATIGSTPLVYGGMVHFVNVDGEVYTVNQDNGSVIWDKSLGGPPSFQITLNDDILIVGRVFSSEDNDRYLMAMDRLTGEERWRFETDSTSGFYLPTIHAGIVYTASSSDYMHALNIETGEEVWRRAISGGSKHPMVSEGVFYFQDDTQLLYALSINDDEVEWIYDPKYKEKTFLSTPVVDACCVYAMMSDGDENSIVKIDKHSGEKIADFPARNRSVSSISLADGIAFFGDDGEGREGNNGYMNAMDMETGELVWRFETGGYVRGAASIAGDTVYFGSHDHYMYAVDRHTGEMKWRFETRAGIASTPAIVNGRVYVGSLDGHVYVLE